MSNALKIKCLFVRYDQHLAIYNRKFSHHDELDVVDKWGRPWGKWCRIVVVAKNEMDYVIDSLRRHMKFSCQSKRSSGVKQWGRCTAFVLQIRVPQYLSFRYECCVCNVQIWQCMFAFERFISQTSSNDVTCLILAALISKMWWFRRISPKDFMLSPHTSSGIWWLWHISSPHPCLNAAINVPHDSNSLSQSIDGRRVLHVNKPSMGKGIVYFERTEVVKSLQIGQYSTVIESLPPLCDFELGVKKKTECEAGTNLGSSDAKDEYEWLARSRRQSRITFQLKSYVLTCLTREVVIEPRAKMKPPSAKHKIEIPTFAGWPSGPGRASSIIRWSRSPVSSSDSFWDAWTGRLNVYWWCVFVFIITYAVICVCLDAEGVMAVREHQAQTTIHCAVLTVVPNILSDVVLVSIPVMLLWNV